MHIVGIPAEYNPFHTGHQYHIRKARELTGADAVVVVMSGNFVQRGEPAITDKYARTAMALANGADAVLELPLSWATGSAERFAQGSVHILNSLGVSHLVCGCEDPDSPLWEPLTVLLNGAGGREPAEAAGPGQIPAPVSHLSQDPGPIPAPPPLPLQDPAAYSRWDLPIRYRETLQNRLKSGLSYPAARSAAAEEVLPGAASLLAKPNNILALEYRKAIASIPDCRIRPLEIRRTGSGYHDEELKEEEFPSASAIRRLLMNSGSPDPSDDIPGSRHDSDRGTGTLPSTAGHFTAVPADQLCRWLPPSAAEQLRYCIHPDALSSLLQYQLLMCQPGFLTGGKIMAQAHNTAGRQSMSQAPGIADCQDMNPDLANRLLALAGEHPEYSFTQLADALKTRNITRTRANRALLHTLLQVREEARVPEAVRLLGFRRNTGSGASVLRELTDRSRIPIVTKMADAPAGVFDPDIRASHLYNRVVWEQTGILLKDEFRQGPVML